MKTPIPKTKKTTTTSPQKKRRIHNHFPQGKTGYVPRGVGITDFKLLKRDRKCQK